MADDDDDVELTVIDDVESDDSPHDDDADTKAALEAENLRLGEGNISTLYPAVPGSSSSSSGVKLPDQVRCTRKLSRRRQKLLESLEDLVEVVAVPH